MDFGFKGHEAPLPCVPLGVLWGAQLSKVGLNLQEGREVKLIDAFAPRNFDTDESSAPQDAQMAAHSRATDQEVPCDHPCG